MQLIFPIESIPFIRNAASCSALNDPLLSQINLSAKGNSCLVRGTDASIYYRAEFPILCDKDVNLLIPARELANYLSNIETGVGNTTHICLSFDSVFNENSRLKVERGYMNNGKFREIGGYLSLSMADSLFFPDDDTNNVTPIMLIEANELQRGVKFVTVSNGGDLPIGSVITFAQIDNQYVITSANGVTLSRYVLEPKRKKDFSQSLRIPYQLLDRALRFFNKNTDVIVQANDSRLVLDNNNPTNKEKISIILSDGSLANPEKIVVEWQNNITNTVEVSLQEFNQALKLVRPQEETLDGRIICLWSEKLSNFYLYTEVANQSGFEKIENVKKKVNAYCQIAIQMNYLVKVINAFDKTSVSISFASDNRVIIIRDLLEDNKKLACIMGYKTPMSKPNIE